MNPHINLPQLMMLFGGAVFVLSVLILGIYAFQKALRRNVNAGDPKPEKVRVDDEAAFTLATVKGVLTQLKVDQTLAQEKLLAAERRAAENGRKFEVLAREFEQGLMIFDTQGFITFSNPQVRKMLVVDTWSRRRFGEIFQEIPALSELISKGIETGMEIRRRTIEIPKPDGSRRWVETTLLPSRDRSGIMEFVACLFQEIPPPAPDA